MARANAVVGPCVGVCNEQFPRVLGVLLVAEKLVGRTEVRDVEGKVVVRLPDLGVGDVFPLPVRALHRLRDGDGLRDAAVHRHSQRRRLSAESLGRLHHRAEPGDVLLVPCRTGMSLRHAGLPIHFDRAARAGSSRHHGVRDRCDRILLGRGDQRGDVRRRHYAHARPATVGRTLLAVRELALRIRRNALDRHGRALRLDGNLLVLPGEFLEVKRLDDLAVDRDLGPLHAHRAVVVELHQVDALDRARRDEGNHERSALHRRAEERAAPHVARIFLRNRPQPWPILVDRRPDRDGRRAERGLRDVEQFLGGRCS